jgi:predicted dithiol-disulfide oxidoreductase (DUF899 family)
MTEVAEAATRAALHDKRFPNESAEYRKARTALLEAEMELRRRIESVAAQRRALPPGGPVPQDYLFDGFDLASGWAGQRPLSALFGNKETLIVYSFMFGPKMAAACPSCTSILDALDGNSGAIRQRVELAVVARSPIDRIAEFAGERGWRSLRLNSSAANSYNLDYFGEDAEGAQWPMLNVFTRKDGEVRHSFGTELLFVKPEPGQNGRHVDMIWPLWNAFDFTPEGRGTDWYPKLSYD